MELCATGCGRMNCHTFAYRNHSADDEWQGSRITGHGDAATTDDRSCTRDTTADSGLVFGQHDVDCCSRRRTAGACSHTLTVDAGVVCSRGLADGGTSKSTLVCSSRHHGGSSSDGVSCSHFAGEDYRTTGWAFCSHGSSGHLDGDKWREGIVTCGMASRVRFSNTHWCEILTWDHGQWDTQP